jgi:hypothetical protein
LKEIQAKVLEAMERIGNSRVFLVLMICLGLALSVGLWVFPLPVASLWVIDTAIVFGVLCFSYSDWKQLRKKYPLLLYGLGVPLPQELSSQLQSDRDQRRY